MSSVEIKVMDFPNVKRFCYQTAEAITELTVRASKAERERDAQHALALKLTAERDELRARAEKAEAMCQQAMCVYCGYIGPREALAQHVIVDCLKHPLNPVNDPDGVRLYCAGLINDKAQAQHERDEALFIAESRLAELRAKVDGLRGHGSLLDWVSRAELLALFDAENKESL